MFVKKIFVKVIEVMDFEDGDARVDGAVFFFDELPWGFVFLAGVDSGDVEVEQVGLGFFDEVGAVFEFFDAVEFVFHQVVDGFHVGPDSESRRDGFVRSACGFDCFGEGAFFFCLPGADEFASVVGLPGGPVPIPNRDAALFEVFDDLGCEQFRV